MTKRTPTTKDIGLLWQLFKDGQLDLAPEFQRNAIWPTPAKAYLIDTILSDRPIPLLFIQKGRSLQTGRTLYSVIDGQQRLRAIFDFLGDRFKLKESRDPAFYGKYFSQLRVAEQERILNYDLMVDELSGYSDEDIRDVFVRMNRFVVKLSPQELRNAMRDGAFHDFCEKIGQKDFWRDNNVFTRTQRQRMKATEFAAELAILLAEGPQDKKSAIDLYYMRYQEKFDFAKTIESKLETYLKWIAQSVPDLQGSFIRKPVHLYSLISAIDRLVTGGSKLSGLDTKNFSVSLYKLDFDMRSDNPSALATRYNVASGRQTDNIGPRTARMEVMCVLLLGRY